MVNNHKTTILNLACECGHKDIVDMLTSEYKVDINCQDDAGRTPLMIAIAKGLYNVVQKLIQRCKPFNVL